MVSKDLVKPQRIEIIDRKKPLKVMGCLFYGDPFHSKGEWSMENEIGLLWQRFGALYEKHKEMIDRYRVDKGVAYEIHIQPKDYEEAFSYFIEAYDETRFFGLDSENSEIDYYIPIRLKKLKEKGQLK